MSRPDQQSSELVAKWMSGASHLLTVALGIGVLFDRLSQIDLCERFKELERIKHHRIGIYLMALLDMVVCYLTILIREQSLFEFLLQIIASIHTIELTMRVVCDSSLLDMDRQMLITYVGICGVMAFRGPN